MHGGVELGMNGAWWQDVGGVVRGDSDWNGGHSLHGEVYQNGQVEA